MKRAACILVLMLLAAIGGATPGFAKGRVTPYLEVGQVVSAELNNGGDVLTYSSVAAGIDATVQTERTALQVNYRYERQISWDDETNGGDVHTGLARGAYRLARGVSIEGGALATRARIDIRGSAPGILVSRPDNVTQIYSAYAGPAVAAMAGPLLVRGAYRLGYTRVESDSFVLAPGQPRFDQYDDSVQHFATASIGMDTRDRAFGWNVSGNFRREDAGQLDQRFESAGIRADLVVPVSPNVAGVGGIGYEDIEASQRAPLLDAAGAPVVNGKGRFVTDPASPRLLAYDFDGIYWDVGVLWRPSRRTELEARIGERFGSTSVTGSFRYQLSRSTQAGIVVYDTLGTFGQLLNDNLALLPTAFGDGFNPLNPDFGGCVFGREGAGAGGCLNPVFQSVSGSVFRTRGVTAVLSYERGPWSGGFGIGAARRTYRTPAVSGVVSLDGIRDESLFAQAQAGYRIDEKSAFDAAIYMNFFNSGLNGAPDVFSAGATAAYQRRLARNVSGIAAIGLGSSSVDGFEDSLVLSGLLGARVEF